MDGVLLPAACAACEAPGPSPCARCAAELRRAPPSPAPPGLDWCRSLVELDGAGRELVARLKYRNARTSLRWLAAGMADLVGPVAPGRRSGLVVTWAPTTPARRRARGYDQAELLARAVARHLHVRCRRLLRRRPGPHQTGRSLAERRGGVVFEPVGRVRPPAARVVVVDDVVTTGSTLAAAAAALRDAGADQVWGLTAARTPARAVRRGVYHR